MSATTGRIDPATAGAEARLAERPVATALVTALLGAFILFGVGFASPASLHNAAHDGRHAFAFPCH